MKQPLDFQSAKIAFANGEIDSLSHEELTEITAMLVDTFIDNERVRHQALVMADAINSILLRRLLQAQAAENEKSQVWFKRLTGLAVLVAFLQLVVAIALR